MYLTFGSSANYEKAVSSFIEFHKDVSNYPLIKLEAPDYPQYTDLDWKTSNLRSDEYAKFTSGDFSAWTRNTKSSMIQALINIARTIFICILLSIGALFFSRDAEILVLNPIERMIEKVKIIARNPMAASSGEMENAGIMSVMQKNTKKT